jgi:mRNA interferase HigB
MKVHLVKQQTIEDYCAANAGSKTGFTEWLSKLKGADWTNPNDIKTTFGSADLLGKGSERVVFDIGGNSYRMICRYKFAKTMIHLSIRWIGTHAEYDELCGTGKKKKKRSQDPDQYTINLY